MKNTELLPHRDCWSVFMARQYQRYAIELFLWCFESALNEGCRSIDDVVEHWVSGATGGLSHEKQTFRDIMMDTAGSLKRNDDISTSRMWNDKVTAEDDKFEYIAEPMDENAHVHGLRMLAGWYWRVSSWHERDELKKLMSIGGADRMGIAWFIDWMQSRQELPVRDFLKEVFSDLVFSQHMRVALSRFDGESQRLRFVLGDGGIEPTISARNDLGKRNLPWMPDRLDTLIGLLCDCGVVEIDDNNHLHAIGEC